MTELKAVIFDMDGVIIDSEPIHRKFNKGLYKELGLDISEEEYNNFVGVSNRDHWIILKKKYNITESVDELIQIQTNGLIEKLNTLEIGPILGVRELLAEIHNEGIKIALASSSALTYINTVIEKFALTDYFPVLTSGENMEKGKPHPDIFIKTAEKLSVAPEDCVVIEDSKHGVSAARKAGMRCVAYFNPNSGNQDLSHADIIVNSMEEINIKLLKELIKA